MAHLHQTRRNLRHGLPLPAQHLSVALCGYHIQKEISP